MRIVEQHDASGADVVAVDGHVGGQGGGVGSDPLRRRHLLAQHLGAQAGRAQLRGPSGCVKQAFKARVAGRSIASVTFYVDGRKVKKVGRGIYRIQPAEGLASQAASAGVIFGASVVGAPVSTSQVVASSIVGVGGGRRRWRHVRWAAVGDMALAWSLTIPATAVLGALMLLILGGIA